MEAKKIDFWTIELLEEVKMVPYGESGVGADVKTLYIKSWSVAEHKKRFGSIQRLAVQLSRIPMQNHLNMVKDLGSDAKTFLATYSSNEKVEEKVEKVEKVDQMEEIKKNIEVMETAFRISDAEPLFQMFKTFFQESTSKMVFVHEAMADEHAISIDALFNMIAPEDLYYLFASFYVLFLEPLLTPRKR